MKALQPALHAHSQSSSSSQNYLNQLSSQQLSMQSQEKPITPSTGKRKLSIIKQKPISTSLTDPFVSVYLSIRKPEENSENEHHPFRYDIMQDEQTIQIHHPNSIQSFCTNRIFHLGGVLTNTDDPSICFSDMYNHVCGPLIADCMRGYSTALIAYGQSGSGKTYNLFSKNFGMFWKVIKDLFQNIDSQAKNAKYEVCVSVLEVWDKQVNDLIGNTQTKKLRFNKDIGASIEGAEEKKCPSARDAQKIIETALKRRSVQVTNLNAKASRAHLIVRLIVTRRKGSDGKRVSKLDFVDLAGAMRMVNMGASNFSNISSTSTSTTDVGLTETEKDQVSERSGINVSLTTLGKVILQLSKQGDQGFVSYRDSLLTQLLKDMLGGNCKTVLLACMSDHIEYLEDSMSTLRFAERAKYIKNTPIPNEDSSPTVVVDDLKEHISFMQGEISKYASTVSMYKMEMEQQQQEVLQARNQTEILQRLEEDFQELQKKYQFQEKQHISSEEQHRIQYESLMNKISQIELDNKNQQLQFNETEKNLKEQITVLKETEKVLIQSNSDQIAQAKQMKDSLQKKTSALENVTKDFEELKHNTKELQETISNLTIEKENVLHEFSSKLKSVETELEIVQKKYIQNREELEGQIQNLRTEREESLKQYIQQQKENMMYINRQTQEHQSEINSTTKRYQDEIQSLQTGHQQVLKKMEEDSKRELDLIKSHLNQQIQNSTSEIDNLRSQIESLKLAHLSEITNTRDMYQSEIDTMKENNRKNMQDLASNHQEELENILQLQKKKIASIKDELSQAHTNEISQLNKNHDQEINKLSEDLKNQKQANEEVLNQLKKLNEEFIFEKNKSESLLKETISSFESKLQQKSNEFEAMKQSYESQMETLRLDHFNQAKEMEQTHNNYIDNLKKNLSDTLEEMKTKYSNDIQDMESKHKSQLEELNQLHQDQLLSAEQQKLQELDALKIAFNEEKERMMKQNDDTLKQTLDKLNLEHETLLSETKNQYEIKLSEKDKQIQQLGNSVDSISKERYQLDEKNKKYVNWIEKHKKIMLESLSEI